MDSIIKELTDIEDMDCRKEKKDYKGVAAFDNDC